MTSNDQIPSTSQLQFKIPRRFFKTTAARKTTFVRWKEIHYANERWKLDQSCNRDPVLGTIVARLITDEDELPLVWKVEDLHTLRSVERMLSRRCYRSRYLLACEPSDRSRLMARSVMNVAARATAITASWYHKSRLPCTLGLSASVYRICTCAYAASIRIIINTASSYMKLTWARILLHVSLMSTSKRVSLR